MVDYKLFLLFLSDSCNKGHISKENKTKIKEELAESNMIVLEIAEEFQKDGNESLCISKLIEYIKLFQEEDKIIFDDASSPRDRILFQAKKKKSRGNKENIESHRDKAIVSDEVKNDNELNLEHKNF